MLTFTNIFSMQFDTTSNEIKSTSNTIKNNVRYLWEKVKNNKIAYLVDFVANYIFSNFLVNF